MFVTVGVIAHSDLGGSGGMPALPLSKKKKKIL